MSYKDNCIVNVYLTVKCYDASLHITFLLINLSCVDIVSHGYCVNP